MKRNDKIDRFSENLNTLMSDNFNSFSNTGHFLSKKFFFVFGVDIMSKEKEKRSKGCEYIDIQNNSELNYFIELLDIHKADTFRTRVEQSMEKFPVYLELSIHKTIEDSKLSNSGL